MAKEKDGGGADHGQESNARYPQVKLKNVPSKQYD